MVTLIHPGMTYFPLRKNLGMCSRETEADNPRIKTQVTKTCN